MEKVDKEDISNYIINIITCYFILTIVGNLFEFSLNFIYSSYKLPTRNIVLHGFSYGYIEKFFRFLVYLYLLYIHYFFLRYRKFFSEIVVLLILFLVFNLVYIIYSALFRFGDFFLYLSYIFKDSYIYYKWYIVNIFISIVFLSLLILRFRSKFVFKVSLIVIFIIFVFMTFYERNVYYMKIW